MTKLTLGAETLRRCRRLGEVDSGQRDGVTNDEQAELWRLGDQASCRVLGGRNMS